MRGWGPTSLAATKGHDAATKGHGTATEGHGHHQNTTKSLAAGPAAHKNETAWRWSHLEATAV